MNEPFPTLYLVFLFGLGAPCWLLAWTIFDWGALGEWNSCKVEKEHQITVWIGTLKTKLEVLYGLNYLTEQFGNKYNNVEFLYVSYIIDC